MVSDMTIKTLQRIEAFTLIAGFVTLVLYIFVYAWQHEKNQDEIQRLKAESQELHKLWQEAQFDRATKLYAIEGFRKILTRHNIQWLEDEKGIVLEVAPTEPDHATDH